MKKQMLRHCHGSLGSRKTLLRKVIQNIQVVLKVIIFQTRIRTILSFFDKPTFKWEMLQFDSRNPCEGHFQVKEDHFIELYSTKDLDYQN